MRKLAIVMAVLMGVALSTSVADPNVTISGSMEFNAIHRENVSDWTDDVDTLELDLLGLITIPNRGPDGLLGTADDGEDDQENFVDVYVQINLEAELADNVSAMIQLANQRHGTDRFGEDGFVLEVTEAWVELKEFLIPEMTVKMGLQNFAASLRDDGNYFLINTKETFNIAKQADDFGSDVGGVKVTLDLSSMEMADVELPLALHLFWFRAVDPGTTSAWVDAYGAMLGYVFPDEVSNIQLAAINIHDNTGGAAVSYTDVLKQYPTYVLPPPWLGGYEGNVEGGDWWALSAGIQYFLETDAASIELYGEGVWELGDYSETNAPNPYRPSLFLFSEQDDDIDMDAFGGRVGVELTLADVMWAPRIGASYWYRSGDDDPEDGDQENFVSFGKTAETLIAEDALYGYNLNTNYEAWRLSLQVCPADGWALKLQYNDFSLVEDDFEAGYVPPRPLPGFPPLVLSDIQSEDEFGQELDLTATWQYTENVTFMLGLGWFWAGDYIQDNPRVGVRESIFDDDGEDDNAMMVNFRTVVTF